MKGQHGGRRSGAGRKPVLSRSQRIMVGAEYEQRWQRLQDDRTEPNYRANKKNAAIHKSKKNATAGRKIKALQDRNTTLPKNLQLISPERAREWHFPKSIDALLPGGRGVALQSRRPYGKRKTVIDDVMKWCAKEFGITITPRRVAACRAEYHKFIRDNKTPT